MNDTVMDTGVDEAALEDEQVDVSTETELQDNVAGSEEAEEVDALEATPTLFSAPQIEEMAEQLKVSEIVNALVQFSTGVNVQMDEMEKTIIGLMEENVAMREELDAMADFVADAEVSLHRAEGFSDVSESAAPNLNYADAIREFKIRSNVTLARENGPIKPAAKAGEDTPALADDKKKRLGVIPRGNKATANGQRQAKADRMFALLG